ncbi:MAG: hypothetical protein H6924_03840 [Alphaproteobacteria bacterium]|nr:hypothetical protein [Alphaproteobacteria bacterium]
MGIDDFELCWPTCWPDRGAVKALAWATVSRWRASVLILHLIDGTGEKIAATYRTIRGELEAMATAWLMLPRDRGAGMLSTLLTPRRWLGEKGRAGKKPAATRCMWISGVSGEGIQSVLRDMATDPRSARHAQDQKQTAGRHDHRNGQRIGARLVVVKVPRRWSTGARGRAAL